MHDYIPSAREDLSLQQQDESCFNGYIDYIKNIVYTI